MNKHQLSLLVLAVLGVMVADAQDEQVRSSSSMYLQPQAKADVSLCFHIGAEGKRFQPTWGLDQAWINVQNIRKGINHMGKENIGVGRSAFRFTKALTNDSVLASDVVAALSERNANLNIVSPTLPVLLTADQEAGTHEYYVKNKVADNEHWAAMINSHVHWMQKKLRTSCLGNLALQ